MLESTAHHSMGLGFIQRVTRSNERIVGQAVISKDTKEAMKILCVCGFITDKYQWLKLEVNYIQYPVINHRGKYEK